MDETYPETEAANHTENENGFQNEAEETETQTDAMMKLLAEPKPETEPDRMIVTGAFYPQFSCHPDVILHNCQLCRNHT